ncbi:ester cyclase [Acrasis kona]|uniref:Ester cyclase n=1 Tax=Acrasis kona TaxID=1008807 RepID=A0AAW2ZBP4_9EUKA
MMNFSREFLARREPSYVGIIEDFFKALDEDDFETLDDLMDEKDFSYFSWPLHLNRDGFLNHHRSIKSSFPDWAHNHAVNEEQLLHNSIHVPASIKVTATHKGEWSCPNTKQRHKPTNRRIELPEEFVRFIVTKNGTITKYEVIGKSSNSSHIVNQITEK